MWKKWKESELYKKLKEVRVNRAVYLSAIVILLSLAVVLAITAATNRSKKNNVTDLPEPSTTVTPAPTETEEIPDNDTPTIKDESVPELALPVSGKLIKSHSVDTQVFSQTMKDWRVHLGVDIATSANAPVSSVAAGTVEKIWEDPMMGWCVAVKHSEDCMTIYKNLAKTMAEGLAVGNTVQKGQLLGYVGDTALLEVAEDPHLHMEMTLKGLQVDPLEYFSAAVLKTLSEDTIYEEDAGK
ncbi:MAG: M23 family metallopeptidase [Ruminococcaceae bacterium]|nr:M23 family metallopeptidase [Oscillospiraceae bacterium]